MLLHQQLYSLGVTLGRELFDDPDTLRGALDDFIDEGAASTGEVNLLVDAVRLGALRMLLTSIGGGASPQRAVEAAGDFLSRERGTTDVAGPRWACAVLGFAMGKVSETDVERFGRQQTPPAPPQPADLGPAPAAPTAVVPRGAHPPPSGQPPVGQGNVAPPPWQPAGGPPSAGGPSPTYPP